MENASVELALSAVERSELQQHEEVIERGLGTFVDVGNALKAIRDGVGGRGLYRETHRTFEAYCRDRWGMSRFYAHRLIKSAGVVGNLLPIGNIPVNEAQARPLAVLSAEAQCEVWAEVLERAGEDKVTAELVTVAVKEKVKTLPRDMRKEALAEMKREEKAARVLEGETVNIHVSDDSYEWYTPKEVIEAAREVMGGIDLDPATSATAQESVRATRYYTKEDNGLEQQWGGRVFLNPPYSAGLARDFSNRLADCYRSGEVREGILLVNNATETDWFQGLLREHPTCFPDGRLKFWSPNSDTLAARQGQAVFYLGSNRNRFAEVFGRLGAVVRPA